MPLEYRRKITLNSILIYGKQKRIKKFTNRCRIKQLLKIHLTMKNVKLKKKRKTKITTKKRAEKKTPRKQT